MEILTHLILIPRNFKEELAIELQKMISEHRIGLTPGDWVILLGKAREEDIQGIFNEQVAYHGYITGNESIYEAIDFRKTVIQSDSSYGCVFFMTL